MATKCDRRKKIYVCHHFYHFIFSQVFAFAHHAWARESRRAESAEVASLAGFSDNGSSVGGDEGYADEQVLDKCLVYLGLQLN